MMLTLVFKACLLGYELSELCARWGIYASREQRHPSVVLSGFKAANVVLVNMKGNKGFPAKRAFYSYWTSKGPREDFSVRQAHEPWETNIYSQVSSRLHAQIIRPRLFNIRDEL